MTSDEGRVLGVEDVRGSIRDAVVAPDSGVEVAASGRQEAACWTEVDGNH